MGIECLDLGERFALFVPTLSGLQGGWADRGIGPYGGPPERSGWHGRLSTLFPAHPSSLVLQTGCGCTSMGLLWGSMGV